MQVGPSTGAARDVRTGSRMTRSGTGKSPWIAWSVALVLSFATFGRGLSFPFVLDDKSMIGTNPDIRGVDIGRIFTTGAERAYVGDLPMDNYRPVGILSFALDHAWSGLSPAGYRLTNVLLHSIVAAMVFALARSVGLSPVFAWVAMLLFVLHPIHVEPVVQIKGRLEMLAAGFGLAALLVESRGEAGGVAAGLGALLLLAPAMLSKENAFGWIAVAPILGVTRAGAWGDAGAAGRVLARRAWRYVLWIAVGVAVLVARYAVLGYLTPATQTARVDNPLAFVPAPVRVWSALGLVARYARVLAFPARLSPDYSAGVVVPRSFPHGLESWVGLVLAIAAIAGLVWSWRARSATGLCLTIAAATYFPVSNLGVTFGTTMGERLAYQPSIGLCILAALGFASLVSSRAVRGSRGRRGLAWVCLAVTLALFATRSFLRVDDWRDEDTLWRTALEAVPGSAKVLTYAAHEPMRSGDYARASDLLHRAVAVLPLWDQPFAELTSVLLARHEPEEAEAVVDHLAVLRGPSEPDTHHLHGLTLLQLHRYAEAADEFARADALLPSAPAAFNHGFALHEAGDFVASARAYALATARYPGDGRIKRERPRFEESLAHVADDAAVPTCAARVEWSRAWRVYLASEETEASLPPTDLPPCVR